MLPLYMIQCHILPLYMIQCHIFMSIILLLTYFLTVPFVTQRIDVSYLHIPLHCFPFYTLYYILLCILYQRLALTVHLSAVILVCLAVYLYVIHYYCVKFSHSCNSLPLFTSQIYFVGIIFS